MVMDQRMRATHRRLSKSFAALMEEVSAPGAAVPPFVRPGDPSFLYPMNAWPYFVDAEMAREMADAVVGVMRMIRLIPERIFAGDGAAVGTYFGYNDLNYAKEVFSSPNRMETVLARPDFLLTQEGFKCLETNVSPNIGGALTRAWRDAYLALPFLQDFLERHGLRLRYNDTLSQYCQLLLDLADSLDLFDQEGRLTVGLLMSLENPNRHLAASSFETLIAEHLKSIGRELEVSYCLIDHLEDLVIQDDRVWHQGRRIGVLLEYHRHITPLPILEVSKRGGVQLFNGPSYYMMTNKRALSLLSQHAQSDAFSAEERRTIERYIPWSRDIVEGKVQFRGEQEDLVPLLLRKQEWFVLKSGMGLRGAEVMVGRQTSPDVWAQSVATAVASGQWLAQEYLVTEPVLGMTEDGTMAAHELVWGLFSLGERFSGGFLRGAASGNLRGVINSANGAVESLILFEESP